MSSLDISQEGSGRLRKITKSDKLLAAYYEKVKDNYPDISEEDFETICKGAFKYFSTKIADGYRKIHIKGLGNFVPNEKAVVVILNSAYLAIQKKEITMEEYHSRTGKLLQYVESNPKIFSKYKLNFYVDKG